MSQVDLRGFTIDLPEGWRTVHAVFLAPPSPSPAGPLPTLASAAAARPTVAVAAEPVPRGTSAKAYHEAQLAQLHQAGQSLTVLEAASITHHGQAALRTELESEGLGGTRMRQLQIISVVGELAWSVVGTVLEGPNVKSERDALLRVLESVRFE